VKNSFENIERQENASEKREFIYIDYNKNKEIVFQCVATDILEADRLYEEKFNINPIEQTHIGCAIEELKTDENNEEGGNFSSLDI
jgi:hypothetical protein